MAFKQLDFGRHGPLPVLAGNAIGILVGGLSFVWIGAFVGSPTLLLMLGAILGGLIGQRLGRIWSN